MRRYRFVAVFVIAGLMTACSTASSAPPASGGTIAAEVNEWSITLASSTVAAGEVTFNITNSGEKTHEFVVVKTDTAAAELPVTAADEVDEAVLAPVGEVEDIEAGATPPLTLTLEAGHYVILCNLTAHYGKGMYADLTVN